MKQRTLLFYLALFLLTFPVATAAEGDASGSRLRLHIFYGTVMNRFSYRPTPGDADTESGTVQENYSVVGLQMQYPFKVKDLERFELFGNFRHGNRVGDAGTTDTGTPPTDVSDKILSSETIEWHIGLKLLGWDLGGEPDHPRIYLMTRYGFASPEDGPGDLIDDYTYLALGMELRAGIFRDSFLSFGYGRTDVFKENNHQRWKGEVGLAYHFKSGGQPGPHSLMLMGMVDTDMGSGSDDFRLMFGYRFGIDQVLKP